MNCSRNYSRKSVEEAVSPVVGVMLMLVVTLVIAAVVSAFAGSAASGGTQKAPSANVEIHIKNSGEAATSYFSMRVLGVSEPIPTKNLRIVTAYTAKNSDGTMSAGGNATYVGQYGSGVTVPGEMTVFSGNISVPTGYGNGVNEWANATLHPENAQWGNFVLTSGTATSDGPGSDYTSYAYGGHTGLDPMQALLGGKWINLKQGDTVSVRIIHIPSGKAIVDQNVMVEA